MSQVMDINMAKGSAADVPLIPFDDEYPTFGRQPDSRQFAIPEHVDVSDAINFVIKVYRILEIHS